MWRHLAAAFDIDDLRATTREVPDYRYLMETRIAALARHELRTDEAGLIDGMLFWNGLRGKHLCFEAFDLRGCRNFAVGDALNDISMLRAASRGVLFRASATTILAAGDLPRADTGRAALAALDA